MFSVNHASFLGKNIIACFEDCRNDCISRTKTVERYIAREAIERAEFLREISLRTKFGKGNQYRRPRMGNRGMSKIRSEIASFCCTANEPIIPKYISKSRKLVKGVVNGEIGLPFFPHERPYFLHRVSDVFLVYQFFNKSLRKECYLKVFPIPSFR